jgi:hypothetical protein
MTKIKLILLLVVITLGACNKDNYDGPTAGLSGRFLDSETGEPVQQDIIRGTQIEMIEHGYDPVSPQYLIVKNDGTYDNRLLFANTYTVRPVRGNFVPLEPQDIEINGQTVLDFTVTPYIRILSPSITRVGSKVVATFRMEQQVLNEVQKIGLYAHSDSRVGEPMRLVAAEQQLNSVSDPSNTYTLEIDLPSNSSTLKTGLPYYFRIGALIGAGEAKLNYAPAIRIDL